MKKLSIIFSILFLLLFLNTQTASAAVSIPVVPSNAAYCLLPYDPANCGADSNCQNGRPIIVEDSYCGTAPANLCTGAGDTPPWTFYYNATCVGTPVYDPFTGYSCTFNYAWQQIQCNAADRCEDPSIGNLPGYSGGGGGSGQNTSGHVLSGRCNANAYDGNNPISACVSGGWYKQCCTAPGTIEPTTYCQYGSCPAGEITAAGVTSCNAAPVNICEQAGYEVCTPGTVVGSCLNSSGQTCTSYATYQCSFGGQSYCDSSTCAAPCSPLPPTTRSCNVSSWTFSDSNPPPNSTVNVTVNGTANPDWNGASYSLYNGPWTYPGSGPPFNFSVNSDSASNNPHTLRFAINNGSVVCGDTSNNNSFSTQSLNISTN